jgi:adenylate cyclase
VLPAGRVAMAGRSTLMPIWAVVGDEALAQSPAFGELRQAHEVLLKDLAQGQVDRLAENVRKCSGISEQVEPRLKGFYSTIPDRFSDFV